MLREIVLFYPEMMRILCIEMIKSCKSSQHTEPSPVLLCYYYYSKTNSQGELYEYWYDSNGNLVNVRHNSTHGERGRTNPHDHKGYRTKEGHNTESRKAYPPDDDFKPPNSNDGSNSSSKPGNNSNNNSMQATKHAWAAIALPIIVYGGYQLLKWGVATLLAPYTAGGSYIIAGATP